MSQPRRQRQIYGRRTRAVVDEFAALAISKRTSDVKNDEIKPAKENQPLLPPTTKSDTQTEKRVQPKVERKVLSEVDPNIQSPRPPIVSSCRRDGRASPISADPYQDHCRPLLDLSAHDILPFSTWADELAEHFDVIKIAEASFGEVYRLALREKIDQLTSLDESVFKIIALHPPESTLPTGSRARKAMLQKAEAMSKIDDVAMEVRLLQRMSWTPGFTNFRELRIVKGRPSSQFAKAFQTFNSSQIARGKETSVFPDPAKKTSYRDDQLWAVIEMQDAGSDLERLLENGQCTSVWAIWDVFWQVTLSLAKGEQDAEFEHRDLHLGNICVRFAHDPDDETYIKRKKNLNFTGLETTIIDYTISRCALTDAARSSGILKAPEPSNVREDSPRIAYHDLAPKSEAALFEADSTEEYQYEIYRYMRSAVFLDDALARFPVRSSKKVANRSWRDYHPITNLVWLHFLLFKLCETVTWPSARQAPSKTSAAKDYRRWKRAKELEAILLDVQQLLDPAAVCCGKIRSASSLIYTAMRKGWLSARDVHGQEIGEEQGDADTQQMHTLESELVHNIETMKLDVVADAAQA